VASRSGWRGIVGVARRTGTEQQEVSLTLYLVLRQASPSQLRVLAAPFALRTALTREVQPDVLVTRYDDLTEACLPVAPLLVVETLSRSIQLNDRNTKKPTMSGWECRRTGCSTRCSLGARGS
jgi:hypothetical protein